VNTPTSRQRFACVSRIQELEKLDLLRTAPDPCPLHLRGRVRQRLLGRELLDRRRYEVVVKSVVEEERYAARGALASTSVRPFTRPRSVRIRWAALSPAAR
jgi:hypothetical protein